MERIWVRKLPLTRSEVLILERNKVKNSVFLSKRDTCLVDILASSLQDENTVQALSRPVITSTTGNASTHGSCILHLYSSSKKEERAPPANLLRIKG